MSSKAGMITAILSLLIVALPSSVVAGNLMVGGGGLISRPNDGTEGYFSELGYGGGFFFVAPFSENFKWEIDALYFRRRFGAGSGDTAYHFTSDFLEFPALIRWEPGVAWSIGVGAYFSPFLGQLETRTSAGSTSGKYTRSWDYGALFSVRAGGNSWSRLFVEYRFARGFSNIASSGKAYYFEIRALVGIALGRPPKRY
jgi:hypothetical protein